MRIPFCLKHAAVSVDCIEKERVKKPQVVAIVTVKPVKTLEPKEKGSPSAHKLATDLNPQSLYASIMG